MRSSFTRVQVLSPGEEFAALKHVLLRERYLQRLRSACACSTAPPRLNPRICSLIELLRHATIECVEALDTWEQSQLHYPDVQPFVWNNQNYLLKMLHDCDWLDSCAAVHEWLDFNLRSNPFMLPEELLEGDESILLSTQEHAPNLQPQFKVGREYEQQPISPQHPSPPRPQLHTLKPHPRSPYLAPVINDPSILPPLPSLPTKKEMAAKEVKTESNQLWSTSATIFSLADIYRARCAWKFLLKALRVSESSTFHATIGSNWESNSFTASMGRSGFPRTGRLAAEEAAAMAHVQTMVAMTQSLPFTPITASSLQRKAANLDQLLKIKINKIGGELHSLTGAGTNGKCKAVWRKTSIERLEHDIFWMNKNTENVQRVEAQVSEEYALASEAGEEYVNSLQSRLKELNQLKADMRFDYNFVLYEYGHFRKLEALKLDTLSEIDTERQRQSKGDRRTLPCDEEKSRLIEDSSARQIQKKYRATKYWSRVLAFKRKKERSLLKLQSWFRMKIAYNRFQQLRRNTQFALIIQKCRRGLLERTRILQQNIALRRRVAAVTIQRSFRGMVSRRRAARKKVLIGYATQTADAVSVVNLTPGELHALADEIDVHIIRSDSTLPVFVLTLMRAVLFILNGSEQAEQVQRVIADDLVMPVELFGRTLGWQGASEMLRRTSRLLRRLRRLSRYVNVPRPRMIKLSQEAVAHLSKCFNEDHFDLKSLATIENAGAKNALRRLYRWVEGMYQIQMRQATFPEHFVGGNARWFPKYLNLVRQVFWCHAQLTTEETRKNTLSQRIEELLKVGKAFGVEMKIKSTVEESLLQCAKRFQKAKIDLFRFLSKVELQEERQLKHLKDLIQAAHYGIVIAQSDLTNYKEKAEVSGDYDKEHVVRLEKAISAKMVVHGQAKSDHDLYELCVSRDRMSRDKHILAPVELLQFAAVQGALQTQFDLCWNQWLNFETSVGGKAYLIDLPEAKQKMLYDLRGDLRGAESKLFAARSNLRHMLAKVVEDHGSYVKNKRKQLDGGENWDTPSAGDIHAEEVEDAVLVTENISRLKRSRVRTQMPVYLSFTPKLTRTVILYTSKLCPIALKTRLVGNFWPPVELAFNNIAECTPVPESCALVAEAAGIGCDMALESCGGTDFSSTAALQSHIMMTKGSQISETVPVFLNCAHTSVSSQWLSLIHSHVQSQILSVDDGPLILLQAEQRRVLIEIAELLDVQESTYEMFFALNIPDHIRKTAETELTSLLHTVGDVALVGYVLGLLSGDITAALHFDLANVLQEGHEWLRSWLKAPRRLCEKLWNASVRSITFTKLSIVEALCQTKSWHFGIFTTFQTQPLVFCLVRWAMLTYKLALEAVSRGGFLTCEQRKRIATTVIELSCEAQAENGKELAIDDMISEIISGALSNDLLLEKRPGNTLVTVRRESSGRIHNDAVVHRIESIRVYFHADAFYVLAKLEAGNLLTRKIPKTTVERSFLQTSIEILEDTRVTIPGDIHELATAVADFTHIISIDHNLRFEWYRKRYLACTRECNVNGYWCVFDLYEECFGDFYVVMRASHHTCEKVEEFFLEFRFGQTELQKYIIFADKIVESNAVDSMEAPTLGQLIGDRLQIVPSKAMRECAAMGELPPRTPVKKPDLRMRFNGGPGSCVGRTLCRKGPCIFLISIWDVSPTLEVYSLRIQVYYTATSQTIECFFSSLERAFLFGIDKPLLGPATTRLRIVKGAPHRAVFLDITDFPPSTGNNQCSGEAYRVLQNSTGDDLERTILVLNRGFQKKIIGNLEIDVYPDKETIALTVYDVCLCHEFMFTLTPAEFARFVGEMDAEEVLSVLRDVEVNDLNEMLLYLLDACFIQQADSPDGCSTDFEGSTPGGCTHHLVIDAGEDNVYRLLPLQVIEREGVSHFTSEFNETRLNRNDKVKPLVFVHHAECLEEIYAHFYEAKLPNQAAHAAVNPVIKVSSKHRPLRDYAKFEFRQAQQQVTGSFSQSERSGALRRVCWRGVVMPQTLRKTEEDHRLEEVILGRQKVSWQSSLLRDGKNNVRRGPSQPCIPNEPSDDVKSKGGLPIAIYEIVCPGTGPVIRIFDITVYTSKGLKLGSAVISTVHELRQVVGKDYQHLLESAETSLFEHIVKNRLRIVFPRGILTRKTRSAVSVSPSFLTNDSIAMLAFTRIELIKDDMPEEKTLFVPPPPRPREHCYKMEVPDGAVRVLRSGIHFSGRRFVVIGYLYDKSVSYSIMTDKYFAKTNPFDILSTSQLLFFVQDSRTAEIRRLRVRSSLACSVFGPLYIPRLDTHFSRSSFARGVAERLRIVYHPDHTWSIVLPRLAIQDGVREESEDRVRFFHSLADPLQRNQTQSVQPKWLIACATTTVKRRKVSAQLWIAESEKLLLLFQVIDQNTRCETHVQVSDRVFTRLFPDLRVPRGDLPSPEMFRYGFEVLCNHLEVRTTDATQVCYHVNIRD